MDPFETSEADESATDRATALANLREQVIKRETQGVIAMYERAAWNAGATIEETNRAMKEGAPLMTPTIHRNGSSRGMLMDALDAALEALRAAIGAVGATEPNGRDYYPQGPSALPRALVEHRSRLERLQAIRAELNEIREVIDA